MTGLSIIYRAHHQLAFTRNIPADTDRRPNMPGGCRSAGPGLAPGAVDGRAPSNQSPSPVQKRTGGAPGDPAPRAHNRQAEPVMEVAAVCGTTIATVS
jgi:hypothetical protein